MSYSKLAFSLAIILMITWLTSVIQTSYIIDEEARNIDKFVNITTHETIRNSQFNEALSQFIRDNNLSDKSEAEFCKLHLENSIDPIAIHQDHVCIAKHEEAKGNIANAIYHLSKAQDLVYLENTASILNSLIKSPRDLYIPELHKIANDKDNPNSGLANYRLSIIEELGRSDARYKRSIDIQKSFEYRKKAFEALPIKKKSEVNIAMIFDSRYHKYAITSILSMLLSSKLDTHYNFYIIHDEVSLNKEEINQLNQLKDLVDFDLNFVEIDESVVQTKQFCSISQDRIERFSKYHLWRIYLHKFLKLEKVIYIDPDTIILSDLSTVFNYNLQENLIAAVPDWGQYYLNKRRSNSTPFPYFNSGVMLMALEKIRATKIIDEYQSQGFDCTYPDQDILNTIFRTRTSYLGYNWNRLTLNSRVYYPEIVPNIIHFSGIYKPDLADSKPYLFPEYLEFFAAFNKFKN